jgi:hypothetical protein
VGGAKDALADIEALAGEDKHYPGSKKVRKAVAPRVDPWDDVPSLVLHVRGEPIRFYTVGVLASMLDDRKPQTVRKWERQGYIPKPPYYTPSRKVNGQKRLYTRRQIEGIVRIAKEEGVIGASPNRNVSATKFPARVAKLFKRMPL